MYSSEYGLWWGNGLLVTNGTLGGIAYPVPMGSSSFYVIVLGELSWDKGWDKGWEYLMLSDALILL